MALSSDDDDDDEEEEENEEPTPKASPFDAEEKKRSRSRRRRRSENEGRGRESERGSRRHRESRAERRDDGHRDGRTRHHGGGTRSRVPEPPEPPRRREDDGTRADVPEPPDPPRHSSSVPEPPSPPKGKSSLKGGKGKVKGAPKRWKCPLCKARVAAHQAALEQHQWLNEWCIAHQNWEALTYQQQCEPGAWSKCREKAFYTKCGRTSEIVENGLDVPTDEETREPSPRSRPMSSRGPVFLRGKERATEAEPAKTTVERPVGDQVKKKKKKAKKYSSPGSSGSKKAQTKKKKPHKGHKGSDSSGSSAPRSARRKQVLHRCYTLLWAAMFRIWEEEDTCVAVVPCQMESFEHDRWYKYEQHVGGYHRSQFDAAVLDGNELLTHLQNEGGFVREAFWTQMALNQLEGTRESMRHCIAGPAEMHLDFWVEAASLHVLKEKLFGTCSASQVNVVAVDVPARTMDWVEALRAPHEHLQAAEKAELLLNTLLQEIRCTLSIHLLQ
eukprot:s339_g9.t1